jgi:hypothetical protein
MIMETIKLQTHIGADGILKVEMPIGARDVDCDVVIVYTIQDRNEREDWAAFIEATYGSLADDPIERPAPLPLEVRDEIE